MIITNSAIQLSSRHEKQQEHQIRESLVAGEFGPNSGLTADNLRQGVVFEHRESARQLTYDRSLQRQVLQQSRDDLPENARDNARQETNGDAQTAAESQRDNSPTLEALRSVLAAAREAGAERIARDVAGTAAHSQNIDLFGQKAETTVSEEDKINLDAQTYQLKAIVESFTGSRIELRGIRGFGELSSEATNQTNTSAPRSRDASATANDTSEENTTQANIAPNRGLVYEYQESYYEAESSNFSATGSITTADGRSIDFDFSQTLEREFYQEQNINITLGAPELKDPLVINLNNDTLNLTDQRFAFDIDADGVQDNIHFTQGNSGFLSLDKNQNGQIDDGTELFGALSGNGFADLAQYDQDQNGFIDAGDEVYQQLSVLQKDASGNDRLSRLSDLGVGALYLGSTQTPFEVKNQNNELQAVVRQSGVHINNDGTVGSLQQIDLVV